MNLTDRQAQILKTIIEEYTTTAEPVGSLVLEKKYSLGVSPATIRNEMVVLTKQGFLSQPHTSAGRIPTPMALKYYVRELVKEQELSTAEEVAVKEKVWDQRFEADKFLRQVTRVLAETTKDLAVVCTSRGDVYHAGYANILDNPEFYDIDVTREVLSLIDEFNELNDIFSRAAGDEPVHVLVGDDLNSKWLQSLGLVFTDFKAPQLSGSLGVIGPARLNYPQLIPVVRYFGNLVNEISQSW
jgi:heat-inducible transcriptional repressor